jgi:hypothetical protein
MWVYRQERLVQASDDDLVATLERIAARSEQDG